MALTSPYTNNTTTQAPISNVGFKLSKPGYDARTTAGSNFVFDSSWPSLPIAFETTLYNNGIVTVAHNLKFPPLAFVWTTNTDPSGLGNVVSRTIASVDSTNVYLPAGIKTNVKCFQLDLSTDIDYTLAPGDTYRQPYDPNFGVKVVKQGKDINSKDLRDFALHSRAQSPLILAVKTEKTMPSANTGTGIGNVIQYKSVYNYPVWVYGFVKSTVGKYSYAPYYSQAYPRTFTDGFLSYIGYTGTDIGATLVILRDPMFAATQTTVQY
jgi:hypothetical protein